MLVRCFNLRRCVPGILDGLHGLWRRTGLKRYINSWGLTYLPTLLCAITVAFVETYYTIFWNDSIWAVVLNIVFFGILIWKAVLYASFCRRSQD